MLVVQTLFASIFVKAVNFFLENSLFPPRSEGVASSDNLYQAISFLSVQAALTPVVCSHASPPSGFSHLYFSRLKGLSKSLCWPRRCGTMLLQRLVSDVVHGVLCSMPLEKEG